MTTKQELQEANDLLITADKALITAAEEAISTFTKTIADLLSGVPDPAPLTPACQFVTRLQNALTSQSAYELATLKVQYNMHEAETTV